MTTIESMRVVARHFSELELPYAFLGAAVLPLLVDNAEVLEIRPTKDIDLSVEIATLGDHYALEERLRKRGFLNDIREGAPICRWIVDDVTVDVMPTDARVLGKTSEWFDEAVQRAEPRDLSEGITAPVVSKAYFLAAKLTAYRDRGAKDPILRVLIVEFASRDIAQNQDLLRAKQIAEQVLARVRRFFACQTRKSDASNHG